MNIEFIAIVAVGFILIRDVIPNDKVDPVIKGFIIAGIIGLASGVSGLSP